LQPQYYSQDQANTYDVGLIQENISTFQVEALSSQSFPGGDAVDVTATYDNDLLATIGSATRRWQKNDAERIHTITDTISGAGSTPLFINWRLCHLPTGVSSDVHTPLGFTTVPYDFNTAYNVGDRVWIERWPYDFPLFLECSVAGTTAALTEPSDWTATTAYSVDDTVKISSSDAEVKYLICVTAGTSGSTIPAYSTNVDSPSSRYQDGSVVWAVYHPGPQGPGVDGGVTWIAYAGQTDTTFTVPGKVSIRVQGDAFVPVWLPEKWGPTGLWHGSFKDAYVPGFAALYPDKVQHVGRGQIAIIPVNFDGTYNYTHTITVLST